MHTTELSINREYLPGKVWNNSLVQTTLQLLSNIQSPRSLTDNALRVKMQTWLQVRQHSPNPSHSWAFPRPKLWPLLLSFSGRIYTLFSLASQLSICLSTHHEAGFLLQGQEGQDRDRIPHVCFPSQYFNYLKYLLWKASLAVYNCLS